MADDAEPVLLDTDVWSVLFSRRDNRDPRRTAWRQALLGRELVIATQTRAEVLAGAYAGGWGPSRLETLNAQLEAMATVPVDDGVIETFAQLTATLKQSGHGPQAEQHTGDRWVAASAVRHDLVLCSGDRIYHDVPGLRLFE